MKGLRLYQEPPIVDMLICNHIQSLGHKEDLLMVSPTNNYRGDLTLKGSFKMSLDTSLVMRLRNSISKEKLLV